MIVKALTSNTRFGEAVQTLNPFNSPGLTFFYVLTFLFVLLKVTYRIIFEMIGACSLYLPLRQRIASRLVLLAVPSQSLCCCGRCLFSST